VDEAPVFDVYQTVYFFGKNVVKCERLN
jgi:hypothetical protein